MAIRGWYEAALRKGVTTAYLRVGVIAVEDVLCACMQSVRETQANIPLLWRCAWSWQIVFKWTIQISRSTIRRLKIVIALRLSSRNCRRRVSGCGRVRPQCALPIKKQNRDTAGFLDLFHMKSSLTYARSSLRWDIEFGTSSLGWWSIFGVCTVQEDKAGCKRYF